MPWPIARLTSRSLQKFGAACVFSFPFMSCRNMFGRKVPNFFPLDSINLWALGHCDMESAMASPKLHTYRAGFGYFEPHQLRIAKFKAIRAIEAGTPDITDAMESVAPNCATRKLLSCSIPSKSWHFFEKMHQLTSRIIWGLWPSSKPSGIWPRKMQEKQLRRCGKQRARSRS